MTGDIITYASSSTLSEDVESKNYADINTITTV